MANEGQTQTQTETPKETPREKFVRLAETRVSNALHSLTVIGNLAAPSYEYSEEDIAKIETALKDKLDTVVAHLRNPGERREETFKLG